MGTSSAARNTEDVGQPTPTSRKPKDPLLAAVNVQNASAKLAEAIDPPPPVEEPYQFLRPLTPAEEKKLRASIKANGILEPVHITWDGHILDGHHRVRIAIAEVLVPIPAVVVLDSADGAVRRPTKEVKARLNKFDILRRSTVDNYDPFEIAKTLNEARRQMSAEDLDAAVIEMRKARKMSVRAIAEELGTSKSTVGRALAAVPSGTVMPTTITGKDGVEKPSTKTKPVATGPKRKPLTQMKRELEATGSNNLGNLFPKGINRTTTDDEWRAAGIEPYKNPEPVVDAENADGVTRVFLVNLKELTKDINLVRYGYSMLPKGKKAATLRLLQEHVGELVALRSELEAQS
jgi:hypothetical protein